MASYNYVVFFNQYIVAPVLSQYIVSLPMCSCQHTLRQRQKSRERKKTKTAKMSEDKKINKIVKTGRDKKKGQKKLKTKIKRRERKGDEEK